MKLMQEDWYDDTPEPIDYDARYKKWAENVCEACGFDLSTIKVGDGFSCGSKDGDGFTVSVWMQQYHPGEFNRCIVNMVYGQDRETKKFKTTYWETREDITMNLDERYAVNDWLDPILDQLEDKCSKLAGNMKENTITQFFNDSDFGYGNQDDADMKLTGYDGIPDNVADIRGDLSDPAAASEHPLASIYGDFYMFVDPGARTNLDNREPQSQVANQTNMEYHRKDLSRIDSASDVHLETLEQPADEFPRHTQSRSIMEPSVLGGIEAGEVVLERPQIIEGVRYPRGTRIIIESVNDDAMFEDPNAKLCPLCDEPYVGNVCSRCQSGVPGSGAIRVTEGASTCSNCGSPLSPEAVKVGYCDSCDHAL